MASNKNAATGRAIKLRDQGMSTLCLSKNRLRRQYGPEVSTTLFVVESRSRALSAPNAYMRDTFRAGHSNQGKKVVELDFV